MSNGQWYPREWPDRIRALAAGELTPATPKRAATVLLLRDGTEGPSVHMLRRRASMAFAGGAYAYPGGGVDPRDEHLVRWAGPSLETWAERLGVTGTAQAQAIVCAAVRETFEEAGVLLAGETPDSVIGDTTGEDWEKDREALVAHELSFADFLDRRGLVLRSDLLGAWARWITPEFEPRRYDTWFFVAALPAGQRTLTQALDSARAGETPIASSEADLSVWIRPAEAAAGYDRGELTMMPPTISTLRALTHFGSAAEALAAAAGQDLTPVLAQARLEGDELILSWPGHDEFTKHIPTDQAGGAAPGATPGTPGADPGTPGVDPGTPGPDPGTPGAGPAPGPGGAR
ncbi:NUDIX hydrolase [Streptomyces sp. NPDC057271]|uniref:NUDIX hydrolase n=1 Tax=unclassified Streptomyces TaxID=2593676 RepID=UPI003645490D